MVVQCATERKYSARYDIMDIKKQINITQDNISANVRKILFTVLQVKYESQKVTTKVIEIINIIKAVRIKLLF